MNEGHFTNETQSSSFDIHIKFEQETNYENMQADPLLAIDINPNYAKKNNWYWPNYLIVQFRKIYDGPMNMF